MGRIARLLPKIPKNRVSVLSTTLYGIGRKEKSLAEQVREILTKYSGTMLIPGPAVPILGPELVTNGGFDSSAGWPATANVVISGGVANATGVAANSTIITQDIAGVANKVLEVSAAVTVLAGGLILRPGGVNGVAITASGFHKQTISAGSFDTFRAISTASGFTGSVDNVSVREVLGYQNTYSSFVAGNYRESAGQNPAGVDQQVGLVVDAAQLPGPEIATGNNLSGFSNITAEVSHTDSAFTTTGPTVGVAIPVTVGKYYEVVVSGSTTSEEFSVNTYSPVGPARTLVRVGFGRCVVKADFPNIYLRNSTAGVTQITNISVRELPGIHASQATSGFQPYLRQSGGVNSWQFDGSDDRYALSSILSGSNDFCDLHAVTLQPKASASTFADCRNNAGTGTHVGRLRLSNTGILVVAHMNDAGTTVGANGPNIGNIPVVVGSVRQGIAHTVLVDDAAVLSTTLSGAYTCTHSTLGARGSGTSENMQGYLQGSILLPAIPTEAERAILTKFLAKLQGRDM